MPVSLKLEPQIQHFNVCNVFIVWATIIPHFKGLGMKNLQYEIKICQKNYNKVTMTVYTLCVVRILMKQTLHTKLIKACSIYKAKLP